MNDDAWPVRPLGELVIAKYGKALPKGKRHGGAVSVYGSNGVVGHHDVAITKGQTIVIGRKGSSGEVNVSVDACWPIDTTYYIDEFGPFDAGFLEYLLRSLRLPELDRSTAIPGLNRDQLYGIDVPVPPIAEQERLARLLGRCQNRRVSAETHLYAGRQAVERFRQSMLRAACSGRLTAEWRESLAQPGEVVPLRESATPLVETPDGWTWVQLQDLADIRGGVQKGAKAKPGEPTREVPYLRVANVQRGWLDLSEVKTIGASDPKILSLALKPGDILFNEGGDRDKLGRGWIWEGQIEECIHQNHVFRARLHDADMQPRFFSWYGNTFGASYFEDQGKQTVNLASLSMTKLRELPVPVPPLSEQAEIVRRVDKLLALAAALERRIDAAASRVDKGSRSVLAKALRGELIVNEARAQS
jgi:type I restriction enzyme S subunit